MRPTVNRQEGIGHGGNREGIVAAPAIDRDGREVRVINRVIAGDRLHRSYGESVVTSSSTDGSLVDACQARIIDDD